MLNANRGHTIYAFKTKHPYHCKYLSRNNTGWTFFFSFLFLRICAPWVGRACAEQKKILGYPEVGIPTGNEQPRGCWGLDSGPSEEQPGFLNRWALPPAQTDTVYQSLLTAANCWCHHKDYRNSRGRFNWKGVEGGTRFSDDRKFNSSKKRKSEV